MLFECWDDESVPMKDIQYAALTVKRSDGQTFTFGKDYSGSPIFTITYGEKTEVLMILPPAALFTSGKVDFQVALYGSDPTRLTITQYYYNVVADMTNTAAIDESDNVPILTDLIHQTLDTKAQVEQALATAETLRDSMQVTKDEILDLQETLEQAEYVKQAVYDGGEVLVNEASVADINSSLAEKTNRINDLGRNIWDYYSLVVDKGLSTEDWTNAFKQAIADCIANKKSLYVPNYLYKISDTLTIGFRPGFKIRGEDWENTFIRMTANNKPILKFTADNTHSVVIQDVSLEYQTIQDNTNHPNSYAIAWDTGLSTANGFYNWVVERVKIYRANIGIGVLQATGVLPIWGCTFRDILFSDVHVNCFKLTSVSPSGQPSNQLLNLKLFYPTRKNYSYPIRVRSECKIENIDIEDNQNTILYCDTATNLTISNVHCERMTLASANVSPFYIQGSSAKISNVQFQSMIINHSGYSYMVDTANSNISLIIENIVTDISNGSGFTGTMVLLKTSTATTAKYTIVHSPLILGYTSERPGIEPLIQSIDGKPLMKTAAPTAGTWAAGQQILNSAPAAGGYMGWVCTVAGVPGTWKGFGLIQT
jgi:hypothetical protein